mgnify:CR=1 FL=1
MARLEYASDGRLLFTKQMKKEYTILMPMMLPVHFSMMQKILAAEGYKIELLTSTDSQIINEGLKSVHNDTCYPALLVIGQLLDAIKSGKYDKDKLALVITQTGGGCRASNYIHLLRKALKKNGLDNIPVISFNTLGMEKNPGFKLSLKIVIRLISAVIYGDLLMLLANQLRPYEVNKGQTDKLVESWCERLLKTKLSIFDIKNTIPQICKDFDKIEISSTQKVKVGIVGEIYVKFAPLGNNNLERFLQSEDCEVVVPGLIDFIIYCADSHIVDTQFFGMKPIGGFVSKLLKSFFIHMQNIVIDCVRGFRKFRAPASFEQIKAMAGEYLSAGNKMGEGWLLTGEMVELINSGVENIICTQPFGCLPNHIVGKGMIRKIRENHSSANIVAIDYDAGATKINQENRIKLMLSVAKQKLSQKEQLSFTAEERQPADSAV